MNYLLIGLKFLLLLVAFGLSFYIVLSMYSRVEKGIMEAIPIFLPFILLMIIFSINISLKQKAVNNNLFYNLTCCLVFFCICLVSLRAILDQNMVLNGIMGYHINFSYYGDFIVFMKMMMYGLLISNIIFILTSKNKKEKVKNDIEVL